MLEFEKYPSINQYRQVVKEVNRCSTLGPSETTLNFKGTVKAHGTNAGFQYDPSTGEYLTQSRNRVISLGDDNAGFAKFCDEYLDDLISICKSVKDDSNIITLFGEWCGENIQKGVALAELPKMFIIFGVKIGERWLVLPPSLNYICKAPIYCINEFPTFSIDIDFSRPEESQELLEQATMRVEEECPIGKYLGVSGVGEGIVWTHNSSHGLFRFKVKGQKHSVSKVKTLAPVDTVKMANIRTFVDYTVTENRLKQGMDEVFTQNNIEPSQKGTGDFLRWIIKDIHKEESDTLEDSGLDPKEVNKYLSEKARKWFFSNF